jgi:hypothetical protein
LDFQKESIIWAVAVPGRYGNAPSAFGCRSSPVSVRDSNTSLLKKVLSAMRKGFGGHVESPSVVKMKQGL